MKANQSRKSENMEQDRLEQSEHAAKMQHQRDMIARFEDLLSDTFGLEGAVKILDNFYKVTVTKVGVMNYRVNLKDISGRIPYSWFCSWNNDDGWKNIDLSVLRKLL